MISAEHVDAALRDLAPHLWSFILGGLLVYPDPHQLVTPTELFNDFVCSVPLLDVDATSVILRNLLVTWHQVLQRVVFEVDECDVFGHFEICRLDTLIHTKEFMVKGGNETVIVGLNYVKPWVTYVDIFSQI